MEVFHASLQVFLFVVERGTEVSPDLSPEGKVFGMRRHSSASTAGR